MNVLIEFYNFVSSFFCILIIFLLYLFVRVIIPLVVFLGIPYLLWRFIGYWRSL